MIYLIYEGTVYYTTDNNESVTLNDGYDDYTVTIATKKLHCYLENMSDWCLVDAPNPVLALDYAKKIDKSVNTRNLDIRYRKGSDLNSFRSFILYGDCVQNYPKFVHTLRNIILTELAEDIPAIDLISTPFVYTYRAT